MFDIDHKAGIMASATALSKIRQMKSFQPSSGNEIISKLCALKDDFSRQTSATRLAVYKLLQSLITSPDVAKDLQQRHGEADRYGVRREGQRVARPRDLDLVGGHVA